MPTLKAPEVTAPLVEHALWWASQGWQVFPVCSPAMGEHTHTWLKGEPCTKDIGKAPMVGSGFKSGTAKAETIRGWWEKWPDANIGSQPPEGHIIVDIDGETDVDFPPTRVHSSGKGIHRIYRDNITKPMPQGNRLWPNVDTRTHGKGYVVLPPSMHASGTRYRVLSDGPVTVFPAEMVPDKAQLARAKKAQAEHSEVVKLLTAPRDSDILGDDAMSVVAGYLARYIPDMPHWEALLGAVNLSLSDPLPESAMAKKRGIYEKHQASTEAKEAKSLDDEAHGWLFELGEVGYSTEIGSGDKLDYVAFSDFRVTARGLIIDADCQTWIVDFHRADGTTLAGQRLSSKVLANTARLRGWCLDRGMVLHDNAKDSRKALGARLVKLMQSQDPPVWTSRSYYGWCDETQAFLTPTGEVTAEEGLRQFTKVYPEDELQFSAPTTFRWEADLDQAREWLRRVLELQEEAESVKVGAWLMMLWLRGQWKGMLPGILVEASAGVGKTAFWQLLSKLAGSHNEGEAYTIPTARDALAGNPSGFVWLDDVSTSPQMEELIRKAITQGKLTLKEKEEGGKWRNTYKYLRGSVVVSGEGTDFYRQKAQRDRFVEVVFSKAKRGTDATKLSREDIGRGSGILLQETLKQAHLLSVMDELLDGVMDRDKQAQTALRVGARVLDAVMGSGDHYTQLMDAWYFGKAVEEDKGQASEVVLHVLPTMWVALGYPKGAGAFGQVFPLWYDEINRVFWVNATKVANTWNDRRNVNERQRQLTSASNIGRELDACDASKSQTKRISKELAAGLDRSELTPSYRMLPERYSRMVLEAADVHTEDDNA